MPRVSIIIPVWGEYKKYLPDCLNSIKNQTYKDYEIIIVDTETDLPTARNRWIGTAKWEFIAILDVDDLWEEDYLKKTVDKWDIVSTHLKFFWDSNGTFTPWDNPSLEAFKTWNQVASCAVFKRKVWENVWWYDEKMKDWWEDYDFWVRCLKAGYKIKIIPELLYKYRKHWETMAVIAGKKSQQLQKYILNK